MCSDYTHRSNHDLEAVKKPMKIGDWTCRLGESALLAATFSLNKLPVSTSRHQLIPLLPFGIWRFSVSGPVEFVEIGDSRCKEIRGNTSFRIRESIQVDIG
jgi:hypothetical protein